MPIQMPTEAEPVTVHCGDCLEMLPSIPAGAVSAIVTDPPFGARRPSAWRSADDQFPEIDGNDSVHGEWLVPAYERLRDGGALYLFTCWDRLQEWRQAISSAGFRVRSCVVWDKMIHGLADLQTCWAPQHELILFAAKGRHELRGRRPKDIIRCQRIDAGQLVHPYQKPAQLIRQLIEASTDHGDTVLDPFAGSGTTGHAAIATGRRAILIEKEPAYVEICRRRIAEALGRGKDSLFKELV